MRNKILWSDETKIEFFGLNSQVSRLQETWHPYGEAWWWQHHAVGMFFSGRDWEAGTGRLVRIKGKINGAKYREILDENLLQRTQDLRLGRRFPFQQHNDPKNTAKTVQKWPQNVLEWPNQSPDFNPIEHLWRDLKIAVQRRSPSNLTELEDLEKLPKYRLCQACRVIPKKTRSCNHCQRDYRCFNKVLS
jgi:transposase